MTHQGSVQDFTEEEILERVEAVAATGDQRALAILRQMIEDRQRDGRDSLL